MKEILIFFFLSVIVHCLKKKQKNLQKPNYSQFYHDLGLLPYRHYSLDTFDILLKKFNYTVCFLAICFTPLTYTISQLSVHVNKCRPNIIVFVFSIQVYLIQLNVVGINHNNDVVDDDNGYHLLSTDYILDIIIYDLDASYHIIWLAYTFLVNPRSGPDKYMY